jgi:hypothetical protein
MVVSKRLRQVKFSVTLGTIRHLIPELHDDLAQFIDNLIPPAATQLEVIYTPNE